MNTTGNALNSSLAWETKGWRQEWWLELSKNCCAVGYESTAITNGSIKMNNSDTFITWLYHPGVPCSILQGTVQTQRWTSSRELPILLPICDASQAREHSVDINQQFAPGKNRSIKLHVMSSGITQLVPLTPPISRCLSVSSPHSKQMH